MQWRLSRMGVGSRLPSSRCPLPLYALISPHTGWQVLSADGGVSTLSAATLDNSASQVGNSAFSVPDPVERRFVFGVM